MAVHPPDIYELCPTIPQNQPDAIKGLSASRVNPTCQTLPKSPSSVGFFPRPGQRGLPPELRIIIYDIAISLDADKDVTDILGYENKYLGILRFGSSPFIYYEDSSRVLALLRNGPVWDNDASYSLDIARTTKAFTLLASWDSLKFPDIDWEKDDHHLLALLKAIDLVYALDTEHQCKSTGSRSWRAPLHDTVLRTGVSVLWSRLPQKWFWMFSGDSTFEVASKIPWPHTARQLLQTMLLQLRRKPEINVRIMLHLPEYLPEFVEGEMQKVETSIKEFFRQLRQGMTVTRLPRPLATCIHHRITLVAPEDKTACWKDRLRCIERDIEWDTATLEEVNIMGSRG